MWLWVGLFFLGRGIREAESVLRGGMLEGLLMG
jgi:hypothetical protein